MVALFILPATCNRATINSDPIAQLITENKNATPLTVLLYDMDKTGVFSKVYKHRYRVLTDDQGRVTAKDTEWFTIGSAYYNQHENNIGMEVAAKDTAGDTKRVVGPPGYTNYIGNPKYGYWTGGINDTVVLVEKLPASDSASPLATAVYYNYPTKTTVVLQGKARPDAEQWTALPTDFVVDKAFVKDNPFRATLDSMALKALAKDYYWEFYPHQAYVRTLLQLPTGKIKLEEHQQARRQYGLGYAYYGILLMGGTRRYGTYSNHARAYSSGRQFSRGGGGPGK